jgi:NAD(P)H-hydrate epimerase
MVKVVTAAAMREADRRAMEELGLPGPVLMQAAAMRVAETVFAVKPGPGLVAVAAGPGNNGGDGLAAAWLLQRGGLDVSLWSSVEPGGYRGDAAVFERFLMACSFPIGRLGEPGALERFRAELAGASLVIDALLGTGVGRPVEGLIAQVIEAINRGGAPVLAVDLPSGVCADSGALLGHSVRARWTVTLASPKRGLLLYPGAERAGEIIVGNIHIPDFLLKKSPADLLTASEVQAMLPERPADLHKGTAGRALVVAGSKGMSGAAALAAMACLRGGAGLVYLAAPESVCSALESKLTEVIVLPVPETAVGVVSSQAAGMILDWAEGCSAVAVGPGLAPSAETRALVEALLKSCPKPLVLDAGALGALAGEAGLLSSAQKRPVITPHAGEMGRLLRMEAEAIQASRPEAALIAAQRFNCIVVLKGANTIIAEPEGRFTFNPTGGPTLATAGTGDLLTGLLSALIAGGLAPQQAARAAVFIHGLAGDLAGPGRGRTAGDILNLFPEAFLCLKRAASSPSPWGPYLIPLKPQCRP